MLGIKLLSRIVRVHRIESLCRRIEEEKITEQDTLDALDKLITDSTDSLRNKLIEARSWVSIYFSPDEWRPWQTREAVREILLQELREAKEICREQPVAKS